MAAAKKATTEEAATEKVSAEEAAASKVTTAEEATAEVAAGVAAEEAAEETTEEAAVATDKVALAAEADLMEGIVRGCNGGVLVCGRKRLEELVRGEHVDWRKRFKRVI